MMPEFRYCSSRELCCEVSRLLQLYHECAAIQRSIEANRFSKSTGLNTSSTFMPNEVIFLMFCLSLWAVIMTTRVSGLLSNIVLTICTPSSSGMLMSVMTIFMRVEQSQAVSGCVNARLRVCHRQHGPDDFTGITFIFDQQNGQRLLQYHITPRSGIRRLGLYCVPKACRPCCSL